MKTEKLTTILAGIGLLGAYSHAAAETDNMRDVRWGQLNGYIQAGIRITGSKRQFGRGERVNYYCYLRNLSGHNYAISYEREVPTDRLPEVHRDIYPGSCEPISNPGATGTVEGYALVLKPGEAVRLAGPGIGIGHSPGKRSPTLDYPSEGTFTVKQTLVYRQISIDDMDQVIEQSRLPVPVKTKTCTATIVGTGATVRTATLAVTQLKSVAVPVTTGNDSFNVIDNAAAREDGGAIAWGPAKSGLQAGLRSSHGQRDYRPGDTVDTDYIVRNVGTEVTTVEFKSSPGKDEIVSEVDDRNNKLAPAFEERAPYTVRPTLVPLGPGEMAVIGQTRVGVAKPEDTFADLSCSLHRPTMVTIGPGSYTIRDRDMVRTEVPFAERTMLTTEFVRFNIVETNDDISWQSTWNDLQFGMRLTEIRRSYHAGESVDVSYVVKNPTDRDVRFDYMTAPYNILPITVIKPNGEQIGIPGGVIYSGELYRKNLRPGETFVYGRCLLKNPAGEHKGVVVFDKSGTYRVFEPGREPARSTLAFELTK